MPFEKGKSGNPGGRPKGRNAYNALVMELKAAGEDMPELRTIWRRIIESAKTESDSAANLIFERLDGKPVQPTDITVKSERTDFDRETLLAIANAADGSAGTAQPNGRGNESDKVH